MTEIRTRFAPSPTGFQHIGGLRTAIYSWLLARHFGGKFILRIEDTDQERRVPGAIRFIVEELGWLGVEIDEGPSRADLNAVGEDWPEAPNLGGQSGPYIQSLRLKRYQEIAEELISSGAAYRCDCTPEMLEKERLEQMARKELPGYSGYCRTRNVPADKPHVVRLKMPAKHAVVLMDAVKGRVSWDSVPFRDIVLLKSDGFPTYHLPVVVDDHDMAVSHVMRADEWLPSTPLHILIYEKLGWTPPIFCHLPKVLGPDGKKLSKRHGATSTDVLRAQGYLPEALFNYSVLVGWSPGEGDNQEIFTKEELIKKFSLEHINKASGVFDYNKLAWMNGSYIRALSDDELAARLRPVLKEASLIVRDDRLRAIVPHIKERIKVLPEAVPMLEFLFVDQIKRDLDDMFGKDIDQAKALKILTVSEERLNALQDFSISGIEGILRPLAAELGLKVGAMFVVLRIAVTGKKITPPLFESFAALGKEEVLKRIAEAKLEIERYSLAKAGATLG